VEVNMASSYRFGCGRDIEVVVPSGYGHRVIKARCGTTAHDGGVNQCGKCEVNHPYSMPDEDEGDMEWYDRQEER
jgi:hypothetical protein